MRDITLVKIFVVVIATLGLVSCFKDEKQGTLLRIAVYSQNVEDDPITHTTTQIDSYAFYVKEGSKWEVSSWEDALNHRITNTDNSEQREDPNVIGTFNADAEYQVELDIWSEHVFMLVVDPTNRIYATRQYETPVNWPVTNTQLHLYAWHKSRSVNSWDMTNPFPDEAREPLVPNDDEPADETSEDEITN